MLLLLFVSYCPALSVLGDMFFTLEQSCAPPNTTGQLLGTKQNIRSKSRCGINCFRDSNCVAFIHTGEFISTSLLFFRYMSNSLRPKCRKGKECRMLMNQYTQYI